MTYPTAPPISRPARPTPAIEEIVHAATHGLGAVLAIAVLVALVAAAASTAAVVAVSVFGATLVLLYLTSTVYHAIPARLTRAKHVFRILDHTAIHLLIAGTTTPVALAGIGGGWGWTLFGVTWAIATLGIVVETTALRRHERLSVGLYLVSGWIGAMAIPLLWAWPPVLGLLVAGGIAYTAGVPFYVLDRRWMHAVWHAFVLLGSALHVCAIGACIV